MRILFVGIACLLFGVLTLLLLKDMYFPYPDGGCILRDLLDHPARIARSEYAIRDVPRDDAPRPDVGLRTDLYDGADDHPAAAPYIGTDLDGLAQVRLLQSHRPQRSAFPTTDTELKLMAAAAIIGTSRRWAEIGYRIPAAIGTPRAL